MSLMTTTGWYPAIDIYRSGENQHFYWVKITHTIIINGGMPLYLCAESIDVRGWTEDGFNIRKDDGDPDSIVGPCYSTDLSQEPAISAAEYIGTLKNPKHLRPWKTVQEIPISHWFRFKVELLGISSTPTLYKISGITLYIQDGIKCVGKVHFSGPWRTPIELLRDYEHAPSPDAKEWFPCGLVEE